jgi:hypothetical protein
MYLFFDTETGGLTPDYSLLTLSAIVADSQFNIVSIHDMDPGVYLRLKHANYVTHPRAMEVNRIDLREHDAEGFSVADARDIFLAFVKEAVSATGVRKLIPAGHNVPFDMRFLHAHLLPADEWENYFTHPALDTCAVARFFSSANLISCGCSLVALRRAFNIETGAAHNAENDNLASLKLARRFLQLMPKQLAQFQKGGSAPNGRT